MFLTIFYHSYRPLLPVTVTDDTGKAVPEQVFSILVLPVDNKPPTIERGVRLNVERGGAVVLNNVSLTITDVDTEMDNVQFSLTRSPKHGDVVKLVNQNYRTILRPGLWRNFVNCIRSV